MKSYFWLLIPVILLLGLISLIAQDVARAGTPESGAALQPQTIISQAFTYQGFLNKGTQAVNGTCAISIAAWDSLSAGVKISENSFAAVPVTNGLFSVQLDFSPYSFTNQALWLETSVKCSGDASFMTLSPRLPLTAAPFASYAGYAFSSTTASNALYATSAAYAVNNWGLTGNNGTGASNFLGTLDNTTLNLGANGQVGLRIQPGVDSPNIIGGYAGNIISPTVSGGTIAGGGKYLYENKVTDDFGTIGGGGLNTASGYFSTIGGGGFNTASGSYSGIGGGNNNTASGENSGIGGGENNIASGWYSGIGGGKSNTASGSYSGIGGGNNNTASGVSAIISGGSNNTASGADGTIGGGESNTAAGSGSTVGGGGWNGSTSIGNNANGIASTIAGGFGNLISADGAYGMIGGGQQNQISAPAGTNLAIATISGGFNNKVTLGGATIGGGNSNTSSGFDATVAGGNGNNASGRGAAVPGGLSNLAHGGTSFAAGNRAKSVNNGCFTWADSRDFDFTCSLDNAFTARATGGVYFVTAINNAGTATAGVQLPAGGSGWGVLSDRSSKTNLAAVNGGQLLEKLAQIPIETWSYKTQDASIRHIGPMAQDFAAAFGVGEDNKHINTVDADGVSLAAIQALYRLSQDKDAQIARLEQQVEMLQRRLDSLDPAGAAKSGLPIDPATLFSLAALAGVGLLWLRGQKKQEG